MIMKHEFKVPDGCKVNFTCENGVAIVEIEEEQQEFKENDIVKSYLDDEVSISIFKCADVGNNFDAKCTFNQISDNLFNTTIGVHYKRNRIATDEEKQLLFDKLKEKCLMFDGENIVRWRANKGGCYWFVGGNSVISNTKQYNDSWEEYVYNIGNYFPTKELAEQFQKQYIDLLNNFHKNL